MDSAEINLYTFAEFIKCHWESLMLLLVMARSFDRFSESIECCVRAILHESIGLIRLSHRSFRIFLYGLLLFVVSVSVLPVVFLYRTYPLGVLKVSTAFFFLLLDIDAFSVRVQCFLKSPYFWKHDNSQGIVRSSFWINMISKCPIRLQSYYSTIFGFQFEDSINLLIKILVIGIGAASGYIYLESLCIVLLLEQVLYILLLIIFVPLPIYLIQKSRVFTECLQRNEPKLTSLQQPIRRMHSRLPRVHSKSFSFEDSTYPERCHVDVRPIVQQLESIHAESATLKRIKYLTLTGLFVLYLHNRYILGKYGRTDSMAKLFGPSRTGSFTNDMIDSIHWIVCIILEHTNVNLFCFLFVGILLYYRAKFHASQRTEILNLDVKPLEVKDDLPDWTVHSASRRLSSWNQHSELPGDSTVSKEMINGWAQSSDSLRLCSHLKNTPDGKENSTQLSVNHHRVKQTTQLTASDSELLQLLSAGQLKTRDLESVVNNPIKAVELRRLDLARLQSNPHVLERLPYKEYDYRYVHGQCCEEVIGYVPIPVGKVGPLLLDGHSHYVPLATTEGCLVASTNRGCRALFLAGGVNSVLFRDQMTRAPVVWFSSVLQVVQCIAWIESPEGFSALKAVFEQTSAHIQLLSVFPNPSGHYLHIRFAARTGEAMGMNMVSKATNSALRELHRHFPAMQVISLSGNMCTDKKPAAINTILGRGKSVIAEAHLPATVLAQVLHTTAARLTRLAHAKNWTGSAMAGCPGMLGSNAHAANIVAGIFAATGQDLAQVVDASACLTQFEVGENDSLVASVTMPCVEVGTIGGGTRLPAQRSCLELLDLSVDRPTEHLARLIAATVLAGELSLMAALDTDDLVTAHLRLNRANVKPVACGAVQPTSVPSSANASKPTGNSVWVNNPTISIAVTSDVSSHEEFSHPTM